MYLSMNSRIVSHSAVNVDSDSKGVRCCRNTWNNNRCIHERIRQGIQKADAFPGGTVYFGSCFAVSSITFSWSHPLGCPCTGVPRYQCSRVWVTSVTTGLRKWSIPDKENIINCDKNTRYKTPGS